MQYFRKVVSTVFVKNASAAKREVYNSLAIGADFAEIRIDAFSQPQEAEKLFDLIPNEPLIFSGNRHKIIKSELEIILKAHKRGAYIDLPYINNYEYPSEIRFGKFILSYHGKIDSFGSFEKVIWRMQKRARFIKIVPPKENIFLCAQFLKWIKRINNRIDLISFPTGEESKFARILSLAFGSKWVYCSSPKSEKTVKGQMDIRELLQYNPKKISKKTLLTGLVGFPLNFTLSPQMWNSWFEEKGVDARYLPFVSKDLQNALEALKALKVRFFAVTSPHKVEIINYLDKLSNKAEKSHSVNSVFELENGPLFGFNTDIYGIRQAVSSLKKISSVLILGSGGAARSAIYALKKSNNLFLSSRDEEKGKSLCKDFGINFVPWEEKEEKEYDLIINATSAGSDNFSIPWNTEKGIKAKRILDLVVPKEQLTPFEKFARLNKVKLIRGESVLYHQARIQYRFFLKKLLPDSF